MLRIKYAKLITVFIIIINILLVYYTWKYFLTINKLNNKDSSSGNGGGNSYNAILPVTQKTIKQKDRIQTTNKHIKKSITIIFRDFYNFDNDLKNSIENLVNLIPTIQILLIYDYNLYPPLDYLTNKTVQFKNNIKLINLKFNINKTLRELNPLLLVKTKYCLFLPDSVRINGRNIIQKILREISGSSGSGGFSNNNDISARFSNVNSEKEKEKEKNIPQKIVVIPFNSNQKKYVSCCEINLDFNNWTIEYNMLNSTVKNNCDMVR